MAQKTKKKPNMAYKKLKSLASKGKRNITLYYTREVNGKKVPNYKTIALSAGILGAAATGAYLMRRHKKYGHVFKKKK